MPDDLDASGGVSVGAVITAFEPQVGLVEACRAVLAQADVVVIVDDGSASAIDEVLDACRELGAVVVRHSTNRGIGAALNTGVDEVRRHLDAGSQTYVLTLDQDSVVPDGYLAALLAAARSAAHAGMTVGMVGPEQATGIRSAGARTEGEVVHSKEPIQSGLLIPTATFDALGPFAAELFIDGVDTEFYLRATTHGRVVVVAPGATLEHRLGREHIVRLAGRRLALTYAADFRYYYIARNRIALLHRYARQAPGWAIGAVAKDLRHLTVTTLLVPGRRARLTSIAAGLRDGMRGISGQRPGRG
ncbi:MAG: glycosyltransferase [Cellulomonas sp.]|nr:glycosyltransferase [Cellulomonas sp.]